MKISVKAAALWVAGLAMLGAATPAAAQNGQSVFSNCDGYGIPAPGGDGMTKYANFLGIFNPPGYGTTARTSANYGESGVAQCDLALADTRLKPQFWMRRVNLMKARALHNLERGDPAAALADLDRAKAAVQAPDDPFYSRSLGLSLELTRAYALRKQGKDAEAADIALKAWATRPYTRSLAVGGIYVMGEDSKLPQAERLRLAVATYQPTSVVAVYHGLIEQQRWSEAVGLYPQLRPPLSSRTVRTYGGGSYDLRYADTYKDGLFRITYAGSQAYSLAVLGRYAEARKELTQASSILAGAIEPPTAPQPKKPGAKIPADQIEAYNAEVARRKRLTREGKALIGTWNTFVEQRIMVGEGRIDDFFKSLGIEPLPRDTLTIELIDTLLPKLPASEKAAAEALKSLRARIVAEAAKSERDDGNDGVRVLFEYLPAPETGDRLPRYKKSAIVWGTADGFTVTERPRAGDNGVEEVLITFRGVAAPAVIVEEMAILRAADVALQKGKTGFVILTRDDVEHSVTSTYYGTPLRTDPNGYETSITVAFVDLAAPPAPYDGAKWRIIDANAVYSALAPIYIRPDTKGRK